MMFRFSTLGAALVALCLAPASAQELCRSVSTSWEAGGISWSTRISSAAENGCKKIWQSRNGVEEEGLDCNCDLVIDGREDTYPPVASERQSARLRELCLGPDAEPKPEVPRIQVISGG